jgi:hypothetical protein
VSPVDLGLQGKIAVVATAGIGLAIIWYPRALR